MEASEAIHGSSSNQGKIYSTKASDTGVIVKINSMKLIRLVRGHEVLYNSLADGYNDKSHKEIIWERIYRALFPFYDSYKPHHQDCIRTNVRRRWKTLRDSISREVKKNATLENYSRKKESPIIAELEFLIPHIKSSHCAKLADEMGLRECYTSTMMVEQETQDEDSLNDLIDLTEECDIKPFIKQDGFQYDDMDTSDGAFSQETFSPLVNSSVGNHFTNGIEVVPATENDESIHSSWNKEFCTLAQFKGGEFINPVDLCTEQENGENLEASDKEAKEMEKSVTLPVNDIATDEPISKRARHESEDSSKELQAKILQLLSSLEHRERSDYETQDEDRMFLLSLVSDLKRVPAAKKMMVKMEIVTAIARANQSQ
ncbi:uncharacterized protein LOC126759445 [Bactrocera neohumeralis]|uniref:uncharacterized protein LOC120775478 n=1 Tax=Bactrocera tryoni TaxID=59916 RepID=UPI001A98D8AB|nr:uncharacterized protein LOC120775478 [Bactrocera tryoni]XP_050330217.1 uncharacterized protein LOC126759445 [Bactrocera neohumeralis]